MELVDRGVRSQWGLGEALATICIEAGTPRALKA